MLTSKVHGTEERRTMKGLGYWLCLAALLGLATGCGGGEPPPGPAIRKVTATIDAKPAPSTTSAIPAEAKPLPQSPGEATASATDSSDPDSFQIISEEPLWEVVGRVDPEVVAVNVSGLPEGADSSSFEFGAGSARLNLNGNIPTNTQGVGAAPTIIPNRNAPKINPVATPSTTANVKPGEMPEGFLPVEGVERSPEGYPWKIICEKDGKEMILIPSGVFLRGVDDGPSDAGPMQHVFLDAFYIDTTEVTVAEYEVFREEIREENKRYPQPLNINSSLEQPVLGITWGEALYYTRWAGKQLPTEAQWEKAARGNEGFQYVWGNGRVLWHRPRLPSQIDDVKSFRTDISPFGVYDLAGNAREWCADLYSATAYAQAAGDEATVRNPEGPKTASRNGHRVVRGANPDWSVWSRGSMGMSERNPNIGFRGILSLTVADEDEEKSDVDSQKPNTRTNGNTTGKPSKGKSF